MGDAQRKLLEDFDLTPDEYKHAWIAVKAVNKLFRLRVARTGVKQPQAVTIMVNSIKHTIGTTLMCADIERAVR